MRLGASKFSHQKTLNPFHIHQSQQQYSPHQIISVFPNSTRRCRNRSLRTCLSTAKHPISIIHSWKSVFGLSSAPSPEFSRHPYIVKWYRRVSSYRPLYRNLQLCTYGKFSRKYSTNRVFLRASNTFAFDKVCSDKKAINDGCYRSPKVDTWRSGFSHRFQKFNNVSRCIIVRSELAEAGTPADSYPISDLKLGSKIRGILFYAVTSLSAIVLFVIMLGVHPFVLLLDRYRKRAHHLVAKIWATCTVSPFYKVQFEGLENLPNPDTPAVYVSNHQSFLDIYTLLTLGRSFKFISKTAIFLIPIIGWAMFLMGTIPLKRMDSRSQLECLKRCIALVRNGASVFFFPEGTRSRDGKLGAFKKGAFSIAVKTGVPVIPITLEGTGKIMPTGMETILNPGSVRVVIHKPIEGNDAEALCNEARKIIATALDKDV